MGNLGMKLKSAEALVGQMHLKMNIDEKYWMSEACDELAVRVQRWGFASSNRRAIIRGSGLEMFLEIVKLWEKDEIVIRSAFRALLNTLAEPGSIEHLLEMGGRQIIDQAMQLHKEEPQIKGVGTKIMYALLGKGAYVAMKDVKRVSKAIQYTVPLSVADTIHVEEGKRKRFVVEDTDDPNDMELGQKKGVMRVVASMKKFSHDLVVQEGGIEAFMLLARKGLNPRVIVEAEGIEALVASMTGYPKNYRIQWRGLSTITDLCAHLAVCSELGKRGAVNVVMNAYERFTDNKDIRQQAIWAMSGLCKIGHCQQRLEEVNLKLILYKLIVIPVKSPGTEIDIVVPLKFRQIYSYDDLNLAANPPKKDLYAEKAAEAAKLKAGRGGGGKPTHGTVDDFFTAGEKGLVDW